MVQSRVVPTHLPTLAALPEELQEVAKIRLEHPEMSLRDLGASMDPPLSRSGVNHRLQRIVKFAESLETN